MPAKQNATGANRPTKPREVIPNAVRRESTRRAVISAAAESFDEAGYLATRLDDIVARTGMTKGAVYFHFGSKEALAGALIADQWARWEEVVAEASGGPADAIEQLVALTQRIAVVLRDDPVVRAGARIAVERELIDPDLPAPYDWWVEVFTTFARRARRDGILADHIAPPALARTLAAFLLGAQHFSDSERRGDLRRRTDEFWQLVEPALRA